MKIGEKNQMPLTEKESKIKELKKASRKTRDKRMRQRYDAVRMILQGKRKGEVIEILDISYPTLREYLRKYEADGIKGLEITKKSPGRPKKLTEEQEKALYDCIVDKLPKEVGFAPFVNWTSLLACKWVKKEYEIQFSQRGMLNLLDRLKLSYTRPTYVLKKADEQKQEEFKVEFEDVKKNS